MFYKKIVHPTSNNMNNLYNLRLCFLWVTIILVLITLFRHRQYGQCALHVTVHPDLYQEISLAVTQGCGD